MMSVLPKIIERGWIINVIINVILVESSHHFSCFSSHSFLVLDLFCDVVISGRVYFESLSPVLFSFWAYGETTFPSLSHRIGGAIWLANRVWARKDVYFIQAWPIINLSPSRLSLKATCRVSRREFQRPWDGVSFKWMSHHLNECRK